MSERRACRGVGQIRSTQRKLPTPPAGERSLTSAVIRLAQQYGRYGYRRITALLRNEGWLVNAKRVERIWRREGLKVPQRQPKRGRLWFNDGSCVRLRPRYTGRVWSYDFVMDRTHDGKAFRMLTVIDEHSRQCLATHVQRKLKSDDVLAVLTELFQRHGLPDHIRSDNVLCREAAAGFGQQVSTRRQRSARRIICEPPRVCRRPQLLRGRVYDEQDDEQVCA